MAAAKDSVKVQLNLKRGDDMLNLYASNAAEMSAIVDETVAKLPAVAQRFGLSKSVEAAEAGEVEKQPAQPVAPPAAAGPETAAPTTTSTEGLSPREKARLRLQGGGK